MKFGLRKPSLKKSIKARSTGKIKRAIKKSINPLYGKKGMGYINNPKKSIYNKVYNKTTFGVKDILKGGNTMFTDTTNSNNLKQTNNKHSSTKKSFWKDKKNIAIVVLSILLFGTIISYPSSNTNTSDLQQTNLTSAVNELQTELNDKQSQITTLQTTNKSLTEEKEKLEEEKKELNSKLEDAQKNVSKNSATTSSQTSSSSKTTSYSTSKNTTTSNKQTNSSSQDNSEMVWVGETGTKYHIQSCRTLKGKGHQITLKQALAEGREPCKVCH